MSDVYNFRGKARSSRYQFIIESCVRIARLVRLRSGHKVTVTQVGGTPPLARSGREKKLPCEDVERCTVTKPTRRRRPLNSVRLMARDIVECLHNDFLSPASCKGGILATCEGHL